MHHRGARLAKQADLEWEVFLYWDNSHIFIGAQQVAIEREGVEARRRVRVEFRNLLELARAEREIEHAVAVGSISIWLSRH